MACGTSSGGGHMPSGLRAQPRRPAGSAASASPARRRPAAPASCRDARTRAVRQGILAWVWPWFFLSPARMTFSVVPVRRGAGGHRWNLSADVRAARPDCPWAIARTRRAAIPPGSRVTRESPRPVATSRGPGVARPRRHGLHRVQQLQHQQGGVVGPLHRIEVRALDPAPAVAGQLVRAGEAALAHLGRARAGDEADGAARRVLLQQRRHVVRQRVVDAGLDLAAHGQHDLVARRPRSRPSRRPAACADPSARTPTWPRNAHAPPRATATRGAACARSRPGPRARSGPRAWPCARCARASR